MIPFVRDEAQPRVREVCVACDSDHSKLALGREPGRIVFMINRKRLARVLVLTLSCGFAFPVKCHSIFDRRKPLPDDSEYEYVTVSGSQIRQRVKKGTAGVNSSAVDTVDAESARRAIDRARKIPPPGK